MYYNILKSSLSAQNGTAGWSAEWGRSPFAYSILVDNAVCRLLKGWSLLQFPVGRRFGTVAFGLLPDVP
jgi:hypothetical protein